MNLKTVDVSPAEARAKLDEYAALMHSERTREDDAIAAAYRAAARGHQVISLPRTIAAAGFHDDGLPRLAVVRANALTCYVGWDGRNALIFADRDGWDVNRGALVGEHSVRIPVAGDDLPATRRGHWSGRAQTIVPIVPPRFRPRMRRLRHCHLLWEVDSWTPVPPVDPALLRHIRGDLWAVLATWDLTELEQLVLTQRA